MERFKKIVAWCEGFATALIAVTGNHVLTVLKNHQFSSEFGVLVLFFLALFLIRLTSLTVNWIISQSRFLRRFVMGRSYVEGYWFDVVTVPEVKSVREFGIIEIEYMEGRLFVSGTLYDVSFRRIGSFTTYLSRFSDQKLEYAYSRRAEHDKLEEASGLGEYKFTREKPKPLTFNGSFFDSALDKRVLVTGNRIMDKKRIRMLESDDPIKMLEAVKYEASSFLENRPEYRPKFADVAITIPCTEVADKPPSDGGS